MRATGSLLSHQGLPKMNKVSYDQKNISVP